jgi:hypothetical protein
MLLADASAAALAGEWAWLALVPSLPPADAALALDLVLDSLASPTPG